MQKKRTLEEENKQVFQDPWEYLNPLRKIFNPNMVDKLWKQFALNLLQ